MFPILALSLLTLAASCSKRNSDRETLLVFAAASTGDALEEIGRRFQRESRISVQFSFGASNDLARQIRAGAPADVFLSADLAQMNALEQEGLVSSGDRHDLLSNQLVVVERASGARGIQTASDLSRVQRLAIADPEGVPAGVYAKQWLQAQGVWEAVASKVVPTLDVRAGLSAVETESANAGIVYRTDAMHSHKVRIALEIPLDKGPRITYPVAKLKRSTTPASAAFVQFLLSPEAKEIFVQNGFVFLL